MEKQKYETVERENERKTLADELRYRNQNSRLLRKGLQYAEKVFEKLPRGNGVSGDEKDLIWHYWNQTYSASKKAEEVYRSNSYTSRADNVADMRNKLTRYSNAAIGHHDLVFAEIDRLKSIGKDPSNDKEALEKIYEAKGNPLDNWARKIEEEEREERESLLARSIE